MKRATQSLLAPAVASFCTLPCITDAHAQEAAATDDFLGEEKWGAGPTTLALKQQNGWTYGALFNHIWSFAGEGGGRDVSRTFLQPFVSFTTRTSTTFAINTETAYDWTREQWTVPLQQEQAERAENSFSVSFGISCSNRRALCGHVPPPETNQPRTAFAGIVSGD